MANTSFNGPVRSENGFQQINKAAGTGVITKRFVGMKPDLTSLTATAVATSGTLSNDTAHASVAALSFDCAGSDVFRTGSKIETTSSSEVSLDTSIANETKMTFTPANATTNIVTTGCYIYFTCFEDGIWNIASDLAKDPLAVTGTFLFSS